MTTVCIDFETFHSTKLKYDLKSVSMVEYVFSEQFKIHGFGLKVDNSPVVWYSGQASTVLDSLNWNEVTCIAHNAKFDGLILHKLGYRPKRWIDTKAMAKAVLGNQLPSASLKTVSEYLGLPAKGELKTNGVRDLISEQEEELAEYCKRDVENCYSIYNKLKVQIPSSQWELIDWTVRAFLEAELCIDKAKCQQVFKSHIENKRKLVELVGVDPAVLRSNQQFAELLQSEGFSVPTKKNQDGKEIPALSIQDKEFLALAHSDNERLRNLYHSRVAVKQTLEETRARKLVEIADISPYRFDVIFSGAQQTHRFSGSDGCGGNPQNFGRGSELRAALTSPVGKKLIVADFSNIELRVLAFLSRDPELTAAIRNQEDVYCKFASRIYKATITKKHKKERSLGKAAVLGLGYGMGAEKFKKTVYAQTGELLDGSFAQEVVNLYRDTYKAVPQLWRDCERLLDQIHKSDQGYFPKASFLSTKRNEIILPSGLSIKYPNLRFKWRKKFNRWRKEWEYDRYKSKKNQADATKIYGGMVTENLCQALAGEICKEAISRLIDFGYPPCGQVHDELLTVCLADEVEKVKYLVTAAMTNPMPWWSILPLQVEINVGNNWLEAK